MLRLVRWIAICIAILVELWMFKLVSEHVQDPYLDEIFHIPQTQRYCQGNFKSWDPKITTPPGLYILGYLYSGIVDMTGVYGSYCSMDTLRTLNLIGLDLMLPIIGMLITGDMSFSLALTTFPLLAFYGFLFYTDIWSVIFVLSALAIGLTGNSFLTDFTSASFAGISLLFRQTNIVWCAFVAILLLFKTPTKDRSIYRQILDFIQKALSNFSITVPYGMVGASFLAFVKLNGGIALGDKQNHEVGLNLPQIFYCSLFMSFFSVPIWLSLKTIKGYVKFCSGSVLNISFYVMSIAIICGIVSEFTNIHPFLLADNRHYTFYLWRKILHPVWGPSFLQFAIAPVYHFAVYIIMTTLSSSGYSVIVLSAFVGSVFATLVPSPLLEPRYYILPFLMWRLMINKSVPQSRQLMEFGWFLVINLVTFYMFLYRPFKWESEDGLQRFMW